MSPIALTASIPISRRIRLVGSLFALLALLLTLPAVAAQATRALGAAAPAPAFTTLKSQRVHRIPNPPLFDSLATSPDMDGVIESYLIFVDATQTYEAFTLYAPPVAAGQRAPLLTAFHGYGVTWLGIKYFSELLPEAIQRDWFLVAPWQRNTAASASISYASPQSQLHVEAVLKFALRRYRIDRDRIYGIGFSMGGGNALSYAARHRDRRYGAIAAVVNHTGSVAVADVYANVDPSVQSILEQTFGGPPQAVPFEYQRSSTIELDASGALDPLGRHMARNLESVPVQSWYNTADTRVYLREQTALFQRFLGQLPTSRAELIPVTGPFSSCPGQHCWGTVDRSAAVDWLANFTLNDSPSSGTVLTDRSVRWGQFDVVQAQPGAFTSFAFDIEAPANSLELAEPENLTEVATDVWGLGLRTDQPLAIELHGAAGQAMVCRLTGWPNAPGIVERNATARLADCSATGQTSRWCHDPVTQSILIVESGATSASWLILP